MRFGPSTLAFVSILAPLKRLVGVGSVVSAYLRRYNVRYIVCLERYIEDIPIGRFP